MPEQPCSVNLKKPGMAAKTRLYGQQQFLVQDPDGYLLRFCQGPGRAHAGQSSGNRKDSGMKFLDQARIYLKSGDGGAGCISFRRVKYVEFWWSRWRRRRDVAAISFLNA